MRRTAAFSLIEALVSVAIMAIGLVVILQAFDVSLFGLISARDDFAVTELLRETLSDIERGARAGVRPAPGEEAYPPPRDAFRRRVRVRDITPPAGRQEQDGTLWEVIVGVGRATDAEPRRQTLLVYVPPEETNDVPHP